MINSFIAIDIETTGLSPRKDKIIEIGAVKVVDGQVCETFSKLVQPNIPLSPKITSLTGITDYMLLEAESMERVLMELLSFLGNEVLLGHNLIFDFSFIKEGFFKMGMDFQREGIDTLLLARKLHKELDSRTLGSLCHHYGIVNAHAHRAFDDAKATSMLYFKLLQEFGEEHSELFGPKPLQYQIKKEIPITNRQKKYLLDLMKCHKIKGQDLDSMSKSEASRCIDNIIFHYGRMH